MKKLSLLSLMFLIFSFANAYGAEIKFKTNSSDQSSALTTSTFKNQVSAGADFIASVNSVNKVYGGKSGLKFGTSSAAGDFTITLADAAQLKNPTITIASAKYGSESTSFEVYLNGATSANATITAGATSGNSFTFSGIVTKIQIKSKGKRAYLSSITIEGEEGGSDLTPTSLAWSAETAIATIGADNTFPTLITTPTDLTGITYASSNTDIATIATDGTITLGACGVTTIMASFAGDDTHKVADDAKYTLTVVNPNAPEFQLFTGNLQAGEYVVYYNKVAMKAAVSSDRLGYETVNPIEDVIQTDYATIIWKIEQNGEYWTLYNTSAGKYAAGNGTKNQAALVSSVSDAALWTVTVSNGKFEFVNKKNAEASVNKNLRYNEGYGFACYGTSTGGALSLYKKADDANAISSPTISGADEFIESTEVTISAEDGLKVYYTLDGTDPTNASTEYTAPFELTATTTVKAVAYDGEKASDIISKTFKQLQVLTCEEAAELCAATESADKYVIRGYVTDIATAWSDQYSNISFWMADTKDGGKVFEAFRVQPIIAAEKSVKVGDYVEVIGKIVLYNTTPETAQGGTYTIIPAPVINHTITVSANPAEAGTVTGGGEFEETDEITVKAVANEGYEFVNWTEGETVVSTEANYSFEVLADRNLIANFIKKTISYELNGGAFPEVKVPTNEELALVFKQEYAEYFAIEGLTDTDMKREVGNFIYVTNSKGGDAIKFITENANWKWLHDYILTVAGNIPEGTNVGFYWRANLDGFFHCKNAVAVGGVASADYTEAGKPEAWGAAYQAAHVVVLPTEPVDAPYTLPTPVKEGYKFVGWYNNAEGTGEPMTVIPAGWDGTLYAIWVEIYTITVEAENGTVEGAGNYEHGAEATLTATAAEGYEFTCWTSGEDTVSTANPYKFTVTADVALVANFKEAAPTYDLELVAKDLYSASDEVKTQFEGSNSLNPDMTISVTLFASKYGTYTSTGAEEDEFNAFYAGSQILGELTYSYSDELKSDLVVIIGTITDEEETSTIKVTMYEEYLEPTDVVVLNNLQKNVQKMGWMSNLMLFNAANDTIITISGCDGTYGKYSAWGTFGADELEGKGEWKNDGENDVFVGVLYNADKTKVFQVTATTPAEKIKEYTYELADVSFTLSEVSNTLIIEAYAEEPEPVQVYLELAGWTPEQTIYAVGEMSGSIANMDNIEGADVANLTYEVESYLEGKELTITAQVEDAAGNTYLLILTGEYDSTTTALDNLNTTVAPVKMIENGQLIIINNGVQFNAQGQVIK